MSDVEGQELDESRVLLLREGPVPPVDVEAVVLEDGERESWLIGRTGRTGTERKFWKDSMASTRSETSSVVGDAIGLSEGVTVSFEEPSVGVELDFSDE